MNFTFGVKMCLQGTKALAVALVTNTSILRLNLRDNWTEGMGGAAVAEMLKENCYIKGDFFLAAQARTRFLCPYLLLPDLKSVTAHPLTCHSHHNYTALHMPQHLSSPFNVY